MTRSEKEWNTLQRLGTTDGWFLIIKVESVTQLVFISLKVLRDIFRPVGGNSYRSKTRTWTFTGDSILISWIRDPDSHQFRCTEDPYLSVPLVDNWTEMRKTTVRNFVPNVWVNGVLDLFMVNDLISYVRNFCDFQPKFLWHDYFILIVTRRFNTGKVVS